jgi:hypothetical protein
MKKRVEAMLQAYTPHRYQSRQHTRFARRSRVTVPKTDSPRGCAREAWRVRRFSGDEDDARARPSQSGRSLLQLHQAMLNCSQS